MKQRIVQIIVISILITGCSLNNTLSTDLETSSVVITETAVPTQTITITPSPTVTETLSPTPTNTPLPTNTPTPVPQPIQINADNISNLQLIRTIPLFPKGVLSDAVWSKDGKKMIIFTSQNMQVLDSSTLEVIKVFPLHWMDSFMDNDWIQLRDQQGSPVFLDLEGMEIIPFDNEIPVNEQNQLVPYAISPNRELLITAKEPYKLTITNLQTKETSELNYTLNDNVGYTPTRLIISPDSNFAYLSTIRSDGNKYFLLFDLVRGEKLLEKKYSREIDSFSPDGKRLVILNNNFVSLKVTSNLADWSDLSQWFNDWSEGKSTSYYALDYSFLLDSQKIGILYSGNVSNSLEKEVFYISTLLIYNTGTGKVDQFINELPSSAFKFGFSPEGEQFFTLSNDGYIRLWNTQDGSLIQESLPYEPSTQVSVSPDTTKLAYPIPGGFRLLDSAMREILKEFTPYEEARYPSVSFQDNQTISVGFFSNFRTQTDTYNLETMELVRRYPELVGCEFNGSGNIMVCASGDTKVFDAITGRTLLQFRNSSEASRYIVEVSDDGQFTASCRPGSETIYLWDSQKGVQISFLRNQNKAVCGRMDFSDDSTILFSSVGISWEIPSGVVVHDLFTQTDPAQIPDTNKILISPLKDFVIFYPNIYNIKNGTLLYSFMQSSNPYDVYMLEDGLNLTIITDTEIQYWQVLQ